MTLSGKTELNSYKHQNRVSCNMWYDYNCVASNEHWYLFDELES